MGLAMISYVFAVLGCLQFKDAIEGPNERNALSFESLPAAFLLLYELFISGGVLIVGVTWKGAYQPPPSHSLAVMRACVQALWIRC
jgi:hypothetical protein